MSGLGVTLTQTRPAVALLGDQTAFTGLARSMIYRWFTDPHARHVYPDADHPTHSRIFTSDLRSAYSRYGAGSRAGRIVEALLARSEEFAELWSAHEIGIRREDVKRIQHPELGVLDLHCEVLYDADQAQALLVYTATPGTESHEKLRLLSVVGDRPPYL
jgi:hypothetical protein